MLRVALVGIGMMGETHYNIYKSRKDIEIAAVVDIDIKKAELKVKDKNINLYNNIDDMLQKEMIDFVDICTPSYLHMEHAIKAMKKGNHVICEKPTALTSEEVKKMEACAKENNVIFMTAHVIRFWPEYIFLKKVFKEGTYGKFYHGVFTRLGTKPLWSWQNWMLDEKKSGGLLFDLHIHDADFIYYLLGNPMEVSALSKKDGDKIDYLSVIYKYKDAFVTSEAAWYDCSYPFSAAYRVVFENAILEYKYGALYAYEKDKQPVQLLMNSTLLKDSNISINPAGGYYNEIDYFINCVKVNQKPSVITLEENIECIKILEKIKTQIDI